MLRLDGQSDGSTGEMEDPPSDDERDEENKDGGSVSGQSNVVFFGRN